MSADAPSSGTDDGSSGAEGPGVGDPGRLLSISGLRARLRSLKQQKRELGWKGLVKKHGWKPIIVFVVFYLIRDTILYILIPLAIWMGVFG